MKSLLTHEQVMEQLKTVLDPELSVSIVDLGLIYDVKVLDNQGHPDIKILMSLTSPGCPLGGMIEELIKDAMHGLPGVNADQDVSLKVTFDPPWTPDMMSEEVKMELGMM